MNLITIVAIVALLSKRLIRCDECNTDLLQLAFPDPDYVIYGLREDKNMLILPSDIASNRSVMMGLKDLLDGGISTKSEEDNDHFYAILIEVQGLLQFITLWQEKAPSAGKLYSLTRLSYFGAFRLAFTPTPTKIIHETKLITLMYFSDLSHQQFHFKTTRDSRLFLQQIGDFDGQYEIVFGRIGMKLFIDKISKNSDPFIEPTTNIMAVSNETTKWLARRQNSKKPRIDCIVEISSKYGLGILYSRKNLVSAYYKMGDSAFDCYHDTEVSPIHQKGSIYLGFRNGYLFSYRINNEKEKFSEILLALDLSHRTPETKEFGKDDELHLFSINGIETIAVICGPTTYYQIYDMNPRNGFKTLYLEKSNMTIVKELTKKCRKVDYNAKEAKLIFFIDISTAYELQLNINRNGELKQFPDPKLNRYDSYRGNKILYEGIESQWPLHLRNGRKLFYNDRYMEVFHKDYPIAFYGIVNCTAFVIMKLVDFDKLKLQGDGCDRSYHMRAILLDSYMTILRTEDGINVQGVRLKVSIDHNDVENGIKSNGIVAYMHNLTDAEFEQSNWFTIAPNTFDTIHNIDDYTYYQYQPRTNCTYHFRRRKITKRAQKHIKDYPFPALAYPCDFEMFSAMYDEIAHAVVYIMKSKNKTIMVTPNVIVTDKLKNIQNEKFLSHFIYSTTFPYIVYNVKITLDVKFASLGSYAGKILYRESDVVHILPWDDEEIEESMNDTWISVTKALARRDFEKVAFGVESELIERPELRTRKCKLLNAPYFMAFVLKISVLDVLLLLILIILIIYHRAYIIPARRRYKIKMGILRHRKKRKLRDRARRRLRKLNLLRRKRKKEMEAKRKAQLIAMSKKKKSSTSSSDLITVAADEHAKALASLSLTHTYLISGGMLFSCCILPLLYFWFCHP
ncbi:unnamed protein product [Cercopithifilaria johnstoni]|uniref:Uncharacterized protein n=1 Tax=Cercopithifilaria johnstoni TaxID=2874296 RepID=A0A8J2Q4H1_9BILA|nr:unnamed protein product [Cercopithifilaria johnstoni]